MTHCHSWYEAEAAAQALSSTDRRLLLLLVRLPFAWVKLLEHLSGLAGGASLYRSVSHLREVKLIDTLRPSFRPGYTPALLYLTDLGLATVALDQGVEPGDLARRARVRSQDLLNRLPGLPQLVASYELLGALAASRSHCPNLLAWRRPWCQRYYRGTAKHISRVRVPAYAAFAWGEERAEYLLIPDMGMFPLQVYRPLLAQLLVLRRVQRGSLPSLVVATPHAGRADAWRWLLADVSHGRREAILDAAITTWDQVQTGHHDVAPLSVQPRAETEGLVQRLQAQPWKPRHMGRTIPSLVDAVLRSGSRDVRRSLGWIALDLTATDRALLDFIGRHPFLSVADLAIVMGWTTSWTRARRERLVSLGLLRLLAPDEVGAAMADAGLVELTAPGVALVAAQQGLSLKVAIRQNGLVGGGPDHTLGPRPNLVQNFAHTLGVNAFFIQLYRIAQTFRARGGDDALVDWQNAAACGERYIRPDGYGIYRHAGVPFGFFLEYDRGTMKSRDYRAKFAGYYTYRDRCLFRREYDGMPTILIVTTNTSAEERLARAARSVGLGRTLPLSLLFTCEWRLRDPRNLDSLLGPIWRRPDAKVHDRHYLWEVVRY